MNVCQSLVDTARLFADREAIYFEGESVTYGALESLSGRAADVLRESGVQRQDRVGIVIPNVPAFAVWYYACLRIGAVVVSVNTRLQGEEIAFILADCSARVVVMTDDIRNHVQSHLPDCVEHTLTVSVDARACNHQLLADRPGGRVTGFEQMEPDQLATILYTSGTTGFPKGATLSHRNVRATVHAFNHLCNMRTGDRLLLAVPLFHCYGQNALLNAGFNVGATLVLQRRFDLNESRRLIAEQRVTRLFGVPTTFQLLLDACDEGELSSVEYCFSAAAPLPLQVSERWRARFAMPIFEGYGLTETAPFASYNHHFHYVPGSIGTPVDLVEMKIVDSDSGQLCPPGVPGEIAIRGPNVMLGYWNRPEETAAAIRDGWFYSGDIGQTDEQGYFYIVDRLKDMIAVGGQKVFPAEVERWLIEHVAVAEAAVVGFPDELMGEKVVAFVVLAGTQQATARSIRNHCGNHLATFKVPTSVVFLESLPRNPAGKVLKNELRQLEAPHTVTHQVGEPGVAAVAAHESSPSPAAISLLKQLLQATHASNRNRVLTSHLQSEVRDLLGLESPPPADATFMDTGMESLTMVEFRDRLQGQVGTQLTLSATMVFDHPTIAELARYLVDSLSDGHATSANREPVSTNGPQPGQLPADWKKSIEEMPEAKALEALIRELSE